MKRTVLSILTALILCVPTVNARNWGRLLQGGLGLLQSFTISDEQVREYVGQFIVKSDAENKVAASNSTYAVRLANITNGITSVEGQPLNFKVYITPEINAFACADGSVRVYSGLMDVMTDEEVLGVIGHEIGHVANHDTRDAIKTAMQTSAWRDVLASGEGTIAVLTDSQLGDLGESMINAKYSQKQETAADDYAYSFLVAHGRNPLVLAMAFKKLDSLDGSKRSSLTQSLFSSHPDTEKRIKNIEKKASKDGYSYATISSNPSSGGSKSDSWKARHGKK